MRPHLVRIVALEERVGRRGCAACRQWSPVVLIDACGDRSRPDDCPRCGRAVPVTEAVRLEAVALADI